MAIGAPLASTPGNGTASPATVNAPAGRGVNDLLRVSYSQDSTSRTVTTPAGWTLVEGPVTSTTQRGYIYARYADGTSADNFSATISGATNWLCNMLAYPGVDTSGAILTTAIVAHGNNLDASAVTAMTTVSLTTPAVSGCVLIGSFTVDAVSTLRSFTPTSTSPSVGTPVERYDNNEGTGFVASAGYDTVGLTLAQSTAYTMTATCNGSEVGTHYACILAPANGGVTGTLATTLDGAALAATGDESIGGTLAATLDDSTLAAAGDETISGTFATTLDDAVLAASDAGGSVDGTLTVTLTDATLAATGSETISGTLTTTLDAITLAGSGSETIAGTLATVLDDSTLASSGTESIAGTLATTLGDATLAASDGGGSVSGTLATTLDDALLAMAGLETIAGTLAATLADITLSGSGNETISGTLAAILDGATFAAIDLIFVTPAERTLIIPADTRTISIGAESRAEVVSPDARATIVPADDRTTGA